MLFAIAEEPRATVGAAATRVARVVPAANLAADRRRAFVVAPRDLALALAAARRDGLRLLGFYHSHPRGPAAPSADDLRGAWRGTRCVVVAPRCSGAEDVADPEIEVRSFVIAGDTLAEEEAVLA